MQNLAERLLKREHGLTRALSRRQVVMIPIGGAIGTGPFLGSTPAGY
jgi:L-asparagine transporter-like permease